MNDPSGWEVATAIGTCGAAVFAGVAAFVAARAAKSSEAIVEVERDRRAEERFSAGQAGVTASLHKTGLPAGAVSMLHAMSQRHWLEVFNRGPATATSMGIECDKGDFIDDPTELPADLPAGQRAIVSVRGAGGQGATPLVTVTWKNGNGTPGRLDVPKVFLTEP